ncbi:hypothetical protein [Arthrobacter pigmenti]
MERRKVGLITDPDLPTEIAGDIVDDLERVLTESVSDQVEWDIEIRSIALPLDDYGKIVVWRDSNRIKRNNGWDLMVAITELTRRLDKHLIISEVSLTHQAAVISIPALGPIRLRHHTKNALIRVLREMIEDDLQPDRKPSKYAGFRWTKPLVQSPARQETITDDGGKSSHLELKGFRGRTRLLFGMVRVNRPWRLVPSLSSAMAAAAAAAAFGIFYSSIWIMADSLSPPRLLAISTIAIVAMAVWLIFYNDLWEKPRSHRMGRDALLYNSATVATLLVGVTCMYILLFIGAFVGAIIVIPSEYLQTQLQHSISLAAYAQVAWLATSMGITAGALGSSFETDQAIREATYGRREQERHDKVSEDDDDDGNKEQDSGKDSGSEKDPGSGPPWR